MSQIQELEQLVEKYIALLEEMTVTEQQKLQAAKTYDLEGLTACMKSEQAYILQIKGYDQKRLALQKEMSLEGLSLRQLIPKLPEEDQERFSSLSQRLQAAYSQLQPVYDCARQMVEVNEHRVATALDSMKRQAGPDSTYSQEGAINPRKPRAIKNMKI